MSGSVVLGISCDYHDAAAALVVDGRIVAAAEEERFSRRKHDSDVPAEATRACLAIAGITADDVDHIAFYEKPLAVIARNLATRQRLGPRSLPGFVAQAPTLLGRHLFVGARIAKMLQRQGASRPPAVQFIEHHRSHAAAAFYPSPFERAAVLTVDGIGEWATATIGSGAGPHLRLLEEQRFPNSLGLVYSLVTAFCGFTPNDGEYKLMGLAPYGEDRYSDALTELVTTGPDGALTVTDAGLRGFVGGPERNRHLHRIFAGRPRRADGPITQREADIAASMQRLTERAVLAMAARAVEITGERRICLGGGVALNCVANGELVRSGLVDDIWVQPAAGDAGSAIGAALALWHGPLARHRADPDGVDGMSGSLLGPDISDEEALVALRAAGIEPGEPSTIDAVVDDVVARLVRGEVIAWCRGRMEFGPRALGSRSILADARSPSVRARINAAVKGRESFRPFAPAILAERAADWFELEVDSPYMLVVAPVAEAHVVDAGREPTGIADRSAVPRSDIPACTHVDGSARIQTVDGRHADLRQLLTAFEAATGCPLLLNTSFNRAGEPIVATATDAIRSAQACGVDALVVGNYVVDRSQLAGSDV